VTVRLCGETQQLEHMNGYESNTSITHRSTPLNTHLRSQCQTDCRLTDSVTFSIFDREHYLQAYKSYVGMVGAATSVRHVRQTISARPTPLGSSKRLQSCTDEP
jgi:hypothetical protein